MRLTKAQSRVIAIGIICLFFAAGISMVRQRSESAGKRVPPADTTDQAVEATAPASPTVPETSSSFVLNNFERSEVKNGRKIWEIKAAEGAYSPQEATAKLREATLFVYREDGSSVMLTARNAVLHLDGGALKDAEISGGVTATHSENVTMETQAATWNREKNMVRSPGRVKISAPQMDITGKGLTADMETRVLTIEEDVSTVIKPQKKGLHVSSNDDKDKKRAP